MTTYRNAEDIGRQKRARSRGVQVKSEDQQWRPDRYGLVAIVDLRAEEGSATLRSIAHEDPSPSVMHAHIEDPYVVSR